MPKSDIYLLPGLKPVQELLLNAPDQILKIHVRQNLTPSILKLAKSKSIPLNPVDSKALDQLCREQKRGAPISHQGIVAEIRGPNFVQLNELLAITPTAPLPLVLALDQVQDPGNLGSIARSGWGLGCAGLLLPEHNSAAPGPAAFRTSAGALTLLPICEVTNLARALDSAAEQGFAIYCATGSRNGENAFNLDWRFPAILVLGNEARGVRPGVAKRCETCVSIPLARCFDSLNVAQAGAILAACCLASFSRKSMQKISE